MSHEISTVTTRTGEAFFGNEKPAWHGLGTVVAGLLTAGEALEAARLDWTVEQRPLALPDGSIVPDRVANVRIVEGVDESGPTRCDVYLGTVGRQYRAVQNRQAFDFLDSIVGAGQAIYETAGALRDGARVWMLARLPETIAILDDEVVPYLLLSNGHDGRLACRVQLTPTRVVCANTLHLALTCNAERSLAIRHSGEIDEKVEEARRILGIAAAGFESAAADWTTLATAKAGERDVFDYFADVYPTPANPSTRQKNRAANIRDSLAHAYFEGPGSDMDAARGTWWGAYQAVTRHEDHSRWIGSTKGADARFERIAWGSARDVKAIALDLATTRAVEA